MLRKHFNLNQLEKEGYRIYLLKMNRLQSRELITKVTNDLINGGRRIVIPPLLVDLKVVLDAGRSVINPRSDVEKRKRIIKSVDDLSDREKKWLEEGKLLVILDGNHRYPSIIKALENEKTTEETKKYIKDTTEFLIDHLITTKKELNQVFLDINIKRSNISSEDIIPYILESYENEGGPYKYDLAIYSLI